MDEGSKLFFSFNSNSVINGFRIYEKNPKSYKDYANTTIFREVFFKIMGEEIAYNKMSFNDLFGIFTNKGFIQTDPPHIEYDSNEVEGYFKSTFYKESDYFVVKLCFNVFYGGRAENVQGRERYVCMPPIDEIKAQWDTLTYITILWKPNEKNR